MAMMSCLGKKEKLLAQFGDTIVGLDTITRNPLYGIGIYATSTK